MTLRFFLKNKKYRSRSATSEEQISNVGGANHPPNRLLGEDSKKKKKKKRKKKTKERRIEGR